MSAEIIPFARPAGHEVEDAWATLRAFDRAEKADASLLTDKAHRRGKERAAREYERLFTEWCRG